MISAIPHLAAVGSAGTAPPARQCISRRGLFRDQCGVVALWIGLTFPTLLMALGLGIEVASWSVTTVELQRTADAAALAGAMNYNQTSSSSSATTAATNVAVINGIPSGNVTAAVVSGVKNASDTAIKVTVTQNVPLVFANIFSAIGSVTVTASAWGEIVVSGGAGGQPCLTSLSTTVTNGISFGVGAFNIHDPSCTIRSNSGMSFSGAATIDAAGLYAANSISESGAISVTGSLNPSSGTIRDPYLSDTTLQTALTNAASASGPAENITTGTHTLSPGNYDSITVNGAVNLTLSPGLYVVNGNISFSGAANITANGVTIISTGTFGTSSTSALTLNLSAPTTANATGGAIPGVLFASTSSATSTIAGASALPFTGLIYYPNGSLSVTGASTSGGSTCSEIVANTISFVGSANLASGCTSYGTLTFGSLRSTSTISLVQ